VKSLDPGYLDALRLTAGHGSTLKALGEYRGKQELYRRQTPQILDILKQAAVVESAESSNRLEGITAPVERIEALVLRGTMPRDRSEQEIAGYRDALNLLHESARDMAFSVNVILQLHSMLFRYAPAPGGRWKMAQNEIVERNPDGSVRRIRFVPPSPVATPPLMQGLTENYAKVIDAGREPLIIVPLAILDFLCIHPFGDGNGRIARLATTYLLHRTGYGVGRYVSVEQLIYDTKDDYYAALAASTHGWFDDGQHDLWPWAGYLIQRIDDAYERFSARVAAGTTRGTKQDRVRDFVLLHAPPTFTIADIRRALPGVSDNTIRLVLTTLKNAGLITNDGTGRGATWHRT